MDGLKNYQDSDGYLPTAQRRMGFGNVLPGTIDASREGYGMYIGDEISGQIAMDNDRRDLRNSRAAIQEDISYMQDVDALARYPEQRRMQDEALRWEHERREMEMEAARMRFRAEQPALADSMEEAKHRSTVNRERRARLEAAQSSPVFMMFDELYNDGVVSQDTIAEYNARIEGVPGKVRLSAFEQDLATGELYGVSEDGKTIVPFSSTGLLDAWAAYHPEGKEWALSATPAGVREQKRKEYELQAARDKEAFDASLKAQEVERKNRNDYISMLKQEAEMHTETAEDIRKRLSDASYSSEEERLGLEEAYKNAIAQRRQVIQEFNALRTGGNGTPVGGGVSPEQQKLQEAASAASSSGVSTGAQNTVRWQDRRQQQQQ